MANPTLVCSTGDNKECLIQKKILNGGKGPFKNLVDGTKITFHYITRKCDDNKTIIDDSRKIGKGIPMEIILGKKFKFEVWETCLATVLPEEVASFTVDKSLTSTYPIISKQLRDIRSETGHYHHVCGMSIKETGLGHPDLDDLMKNPQSLEFILDILKIEEPGEYKKEAWIMNESEQIEQVPKLQNEGNKAYMSKQYDVAEEKYAEAIGILEQLLTREKPHDEAWNALNNKKIPILLNYAQCKLLQKDYYSVIEHTSEVLNYDSENVKGLFRRAKAHIGAWNPEEARADFEKAAELDPSLQKAINKELHQLALMETKKLQEDKSKLFGKMF